MPQPPKHCKHCNAILVDSDPDDICIDCRFELNIEEEEDSPFLSDPPLPVE